MRAYSTGWTKVQEAAKEVCGVAERKVENPWMVGKEEEANDLRREIMRRIERRDATVEGGEEEQSERAREDLKEARKTWQRETRRWEREWWENELIGCENAANRGDLGTLCKSLRELGERGVTKEEFREHFTRVSVERFENLPEAVERVLDRETDLRSDDRTRGWRERLGRLPERGEVLREMRVLVPYLPAE